ncbi:MAG: putative glycosyltransferase [Bacteroidetes bacterium]|nr:putative glycosyltransferase [Bacteroidota bacterium]
MMNIVFDNIIFSLQKSGGISVYWSELISRMVHNHNFEKYFIETKFTHSNIFRNKLNLENCKIIPEKDRYINRILPVNYSIEGRNHLFHSSYYRLPGTNKNCCQITTVHDFIPELIEKNLRTRLLSIQKYKSIKNSDAIICVSENTKNDLIKLYPEFIKKEIVVIHNGASHDFYSLNDDFSKEPILEGIKNPFCLFIGKRDKYKNFDLAVNYIAKVKDLNLVIVGGGKLREQEYNLLNSKIKGRFCHLNFISNKDLNYLYNKAEFLFYPSEYEGFGIPIVEAQKAGCPYIAKKSSSIVELVENKDLLLNELSFNKIDEARLFIKNNRDTIVKEGIENSKKYTWEKSYDCHVSVYESMYSKKNN